MRKLLAISLCVLACAASAFAQATAGLGSVSGSVRDASGASVPGATVVVANESKGIKRTMTTTDAGVFAAPALVPASGYSITVTKQGFNTYDVKSFEILVGQNVDFSVAMTVGSATTLVDVSSEAPLVETTKNGVTATVGEQQILELPINGRRVDSFVLLTPAVTNDGEFGLISFRGIAMGNSFLTDGNDTTESFYNENAGRTRIGSQISQDAVQEFQVLSNGFSAEFGRAMGGVINTVTKSGQNSTHGTGYWFFRNRTLEATDRYANGYNLPEWRHTAGGSLGGALKKDKLFYFVNFDFVDRSFPALNRIVNNSLTDPTGNFIPASNCVPAAAGPTQAQCTAAINFLTAQMNVLVPRSYKQDAGFAKLDYHVSDRHTISLDMNVMHWRSPHGIQTQAVLTGGAALGNNGNSTVEDRYGKASWTAVVTANAVNELRFGWFKDRLSDPGASDLFPSTGATYITVAGSTVGAAQAYPRTYPSENRYQIVENYSWTRGAHSAKFGMDFQTTQDWMNQLFNAFGGYSYSNLASFAKDFSGNSALGLKSYSTYTQTFGNPIQNIRTTDINFYAQDTWKLSKRLTFNYGLRYEKTWIPQPTVVNSDYPATGVINSPNKNFAPRASLSYAFSDRTVLRAGYGIFYARFHGNALDTLYLGNGKYQTSISINNTQAGAPVFNGVLASATGFPLGTVNLNVADKNFHSPYTQQGTLALDHQLTRDLAISASYIWTRGIGLFVQRDLNLGQPTSQSYTYLIQDASGNNVGAYSTPLFLFANKPDPRYGKILQVENGGQSWYNALVLQLTKRFTHGFQAQVNYTWSHAIDDGNEQGASWNVASSFNNATFNGNYALDKGSSTLDQRHRLSVNWIWSPTIITSGSQTSKFLLNGWELSAITTVASAHPASATVNSPSTSTGAEFPGVSLFYGTLNGSGGSTRVPFLPYDSLDVDQIYNVDARITRKFSLGEHKSLNLGFEAFNAFNTIHNTSIQTAAYSVSGNILKPVTTNGVSHVGDGSASQGFPDGTNARRMQVAVRFVF
jgi:outer membrane receptor protein involved in Fe transport